MVMIKDDKLDELVFDAMFHYNNKVGTTEGQGQLVMSVRDAMIKIIDEWMESDKDE